MFRNTSTVTAPNATIAVAPDELIAISVLALDMTPPSGSWNAFLVERGVEVLVDDLGRSPISRSDARLLLAEQSEAEARKREALERNEQQAIEADRLWRSQLWRGLPADHTPPGVAPAAATLQDGRDAQPKRSSPLQEALANSSELTYHHLPSTEDES